MTCTIGTLGESATDDLVVVLRLDAAGPLLNVATVGSPTPDVDLPDRTDDAAVEVLPAADLGVEKTGPATVGAGDVATYTLTARNAGPSDATGVVVSDQLPAGTSFEGADPDGACTESDGVVTCAVGALAAGDEVALQVRLGVPVELGDQTLLNTASIAGEQGDPDPSDNEDTATTEVGPAVDLRVAKTTPGAVAGGDVTWTVTVLNAGPSTATEVTLEDPLPAGTTFVAAQPGQGSCAPDGTTVRCALGTLAPQGAAQVTITAKVGAALSGSALTNVATATADEPEVEPADNAGTASFTVAAPAPTPVALSISKTASDATPKLGERFAYTITARNAGTVEAPGVVVTDALAAALELVGAEPSQGACAGARAVRCELGTVPAGGEASVIVRVVPRRAGALRNFATVDSALTELAAESTGAVAGVTIESRRATLRLTKRAVRDSVRAGGKVRFDLVVRNRKRAAQDVTLCDVMPASMAVVKARGAKLRGGRPCWRWAFLPAGAKRVVHVTVRVAPGATGRRIVNRATLKADNAGRRKAADAVRVSPRAARGGGVTG